MLNVFKGAGVGRRRGAELLVAWGVPVFVVEAVDPLPCRAAPDDWHGVVSPGRARLLCEGCVVVAECRAYGLGDARLSGVWGGLTEGERKALRGARVTG
ncbi:WhiB family transcriptional regulator [Streptomyces sp. NPDC020766]|uniref:WhiB family transcriptional regulator n=1 Tax=Streptomyces sp. NPDC020766 TaxID=3155011 RepID=UPI0034054A4E